MGRGPAVSWEELFTEAPRLGEDFRAEVNAAAQVPRAPLLFFSSLRGKATLESSDWFQVPRTLSYIRRVAV